MQILQHSFFICRPGRGKQVLLGSVAGEPVYHDMLRKAGYAAPAAAGAIPAGTGETAMRRKVTDFAAEILPIMVTKHFHGHPSCK